MRVHVLGSAAGGGLPQWNCGCGQCQAAREGRLQPRTQDSLLVDGVLFNASPDIRAQMAACAALHPRRERDTPLRAIVLTNGDLDHAVGLLSLRESQPLAVYATAHVTRGLVEHNAFLRTLQRFQGQVQWRLLEPGRPEELRDPEGAPLGITVEAVPVAGKLPVHLTGLVEPDEEDNSGMIVRSVSTDAALGYFPAFARLDEKLLLRMRALRCVFLDGTFWSSDELRAVSPSMPRAEDMAHLPVRESVRVFGAMTGTRRIFTHVNNTNPMLTPSSEAHRAVVDAGCEIAFDGMEVTL